MFVARIHILLVHFPVILLCLWLLFLIPLFVNESDIFRKRVNALCPAMHQSFGPFPNILGRTGVW